MYDPRSTRQCGPLAGPDPRGYNWLAPHTSTAPPRPTNGPDSLADPLLLPALRAIGGATLLGVVLAVLLGVFHRSGNRAAYRRDWSRFLLLVGICIAVLAAASVGRAGLTPVALLLAFFGWRELLAAVTLRYGQPVLPWLLTAAGTLAVLGGLGPTDGWVLGSVTAAAWIALALPMVVYRRPAPLHGSLAAGLGVIYLTLPLALMLSLAGSAFGPFAFLFLVAMGYDGFAAAFGRLLGRHRLCPNLSPHKTWEGAASGLLICAGLGVVLGFLVSSWPQWLAVSVAVGVGLLALIGDLLASSIKREAGVKDFGRVIPVIGGVLDKFDSLIFATPVFYGFVRLYGV